MSKALATTVLHDFNCITGADGKVVAVYTVNASPIVNIATVYPLLNDRRKVSWQTSRNVAEDLVVKQMLIVVVQFFHLYLETMIDFQHAQWQLRYQPS